MTNEYTGGSVSYYTCSVTHPINESADPYDAECIDIIDALLMTPNEANAFKALWRRAAARLGKSKRGYTDGLYDAEKVEFYGKRLVELERRARVTEEPKCDFVPAFKEGLRRAEEEREKALKPENQRVEPIRVNCTECGEPLKNGHACVFSATDPNPQCIPKTDPFGPRDADGWYTWNGDDSMRPAGYVQIADREGEISTILASESIRWNHLQTAGDIVKWRPVEKAKSPECSADCSPGCRSCSSSA